MQHRRRNRNSVRRQRHKPVEILGAFTGVNQDVQKLEVVDSGPDLLDLRFQRNAPVGLFVCRYPHVTDRFWLHIFKNI